jgi:hypothetical protein
MPDIVFWIGQCYFTANKKTLSWTDISLGAEHITRDMFGIVSSVHLKES